MNDSERHAHALSLYNEVADLDPATREAYFAELEASSADGLAIAAELRSLPVFESRTSPVLGPNEAYPYADFYDEDERPPETHGRFDIMRVVGEGGMGTVYRAQQKQPWRLVALKVLKGELTNDRVRRRFAAEGDILARLSHPYIASVYEAINGARPYLVMEYVDGVPLTDWGEAHKPSLRARVELLIKIAEAVDHAHHSGVVHRDLKPANILVTADGIPKILDFGIARVVDPLAGLGRASDSGSGLTQAGEIIGTPAYMSPEQASLDPSRIDHRTDVYVLGVVAYEFLTDNMPYPIGAELLMNLTRIRAIQPTLAGNYDKALRGDIEVILAKTLAKEPADRYQSAAAFAEDLGRWLRRETILARPPSVLYQVGRFARRNRALVIAFGLLFVALVIGAIATTSLWLSGRRTQAELARRVDELVLLQARETLANDPTRSVEMLAALSPEVDWGAAYTIGWDARARGVSERTLSGHEADVEWLDVAPDGAIASASFDGTVRIWRNLSATAKPSMQVLKGHVGGVNRVAWSPDGHLLASAGRDGSLRLWDQPGDTSRVLHQHKSGECEELAWSPNGTQIASIGGDGVLAVVDIAANTKRELVHGDAQLSDVEWRGTTLVASGKNAQLVMVDMRDGRVEQLVGHQAEVDNLDFAPLLAGDTRPRLASGAVDGELRIWDDDGTVRSFTSPDGSAIKALAFIGHERVATVDRAGVVRIWDVPSGKAMVLADGGSVYRGLAVSADGAWLATAADDRMATLWDLKTLDPIVLRGHRDAVLHVAFTPDGHLASGGKEGDIRLWPVPGQRARWPLTSLPRAVAVRGNEVVLVDEEGHLSRGDLATGKLAGIEDKVDGHLAAWAPDGQSFFTSLREGEVHVRSVDGHTQRVVAVDGRPIGIAVAPDSQRFAVVTNSGKLVVTTVSAASEPEVYELPGERANAVAFAGPVVITGHRDGRVMRLQNGHFEELARFLGEAHLVVAHGDLLAAAGSDRAVRWRVPTPTGAIATYQAIGETLHDGPILALASSERRMASGGRDGLIKVIDNDGTAHMFTGHAGAVTALALSGDLVISGGRDRTVRIWDLSAPEKPPHIIDLFGGPIVSLTLASTVAGGALDRIIVLADERALTAWPIVIPRDELSVRAWLATLVRGSDGSDHEPVPAQD